MVVAAGQVREKVHSEEEGENSRGIEGGEGDAMHGEEGPAEAKKGSEMGARAGQWKRAWSSSPRGARGTGPTATLPKEDDTHRKKTSLDGTARTMKCQKFD